MTSRPVIDDLSSFWMPFTANRQFNAAPRDHEPHRHQTVVRLRHREGAQLMRLRELPHRRQQCARAQRLRLDGLREALHDLVDERGSGAPVALEIQFDHGRKCGLGTKKPAATHGPKRIASAQLPPIHQHS